MRLGYDSNPGGETGASVWLGALGMIAIGLALAVGYNAFGLVEGAGFGIAWLGQDRWGDLEKMDAVTAVEAPPTTPVPAAHSDDPLAGLALGGEARNVPTIPDVGRPVPIDLSALKQFFDAGAALIVDARDPDEFAESHIAGALNIPYDVAVSDPALLEGLQTGGRPVITYCGGGSCELSLNLADELYFAGHGPVAVYMGGFPEWVAAGYPVDRGAQ